MIIIDTHALKQIHPVVHVTELRGFQELARRSVHRSSYCALQATNAVA